MSFGNITNKNIFSSLDSISKSLDLVSERLEKLEESCLTGKDSSSKKEAGSIKMLPGIIERITAARDLDGVIFELLETFTSTMDRSLILSLNEERYIPLRSRGYDQIPEKNSFLVDEQDDLLRSAVNSRQILIFKGNIADQFSFASRENTRARYGMFIPIVFGDQVPLVYYGESAESPDPDLAEAVISIATLVIKNQHLTALIRTDLIDGSSDNQKMTVTENGEPVDAEILTGESGYEDISVETESEELSTLTDPGAEPPLPGDSRKIYRSVDDFDTDVISAEELIRSFNININRTIPGLEVETEDFLESPEETEIEDTDSIITSEEDKEDWTEPADLEIQLPIEESIKNTPDPDSIYSVEDEPAPENAPEGWNNEAEWDNLGEKSSPEEETVITAESSPDPGDLISEREEGPPPEEFEEAISFARLLVSEIKLYNEKEVEEGRKNGDLYNRLKEQIDLSRKVYEVRISDEVRAEKDYFNEELLRILAKGNAEILNSE